MDHVWVLTSSSEAASHLEKILGIFTDYATACVAADSTFKESYNNKQWKNVASTPVLISFASNDGILISLKRLPLNALLYPASSGPIPSQATSRAPLKVVFSGDRHATFEKDGAIIAEIISKLSPGDLVIHGGCKGVDLIVDHYARQRGCNVEAYPITKEDSRKYGRGAGPVRNKQMLDQGPDMVICLHPDLSKSKGTKDMHKQATKRNFKIQVVELPS